MVDVVASALHVLALACLVLTALPLRSVPIPRMVACAANASAPERHAAEELAQYLFECSSVCSCASLQRPCRGAGEAGRTRLEGRQECGWLEARLVEPRDGSTTAFCSHHKELKFGVSRMPYDAVSISTLSP